MPSILGANTLSSGFDVDNSLRFNDGDTAFLNKTFSGDGTHHDKGTVSVWLKRGELSSEQGIFIAGSSARHFIRIESGDTLTFRATTDSFHVQTNQLFRDPSAWYHIVVAYDTSQGTASNRVKMYVNGSQVTSFSQTDYPDQNLDIKLGAAELNRIGADSEQNNPYWDGYMCEFVYIDGTQLAADSFGEFDSDSGIWKPIDVSGLTFGTNGFYLQFKETGTSQNSSGLGADTSGNDHHFAVNNLAATDQSTDTCTNNFNTWLPNDPRASNFTLSEGNLDITRTGAFTGGVYAQTIMPSSGKWYAECKIYEQPSSDRGRVGIANFESIPGDMTTTPQSSSPSSVNAVEISFGQGDNLMFTINGSDTENNSFYSAFSNADILRFALDLDNGKFYFGVNANWWNYSSSQTGGDPTSGSGYVSNSSDLFNGSPICFYQGHSSGASVTTGIKWNFGSPPYAISSGNADADGHGNFEFAVPSGYFALCSKNLAEYG